MCLAVDEQLLINLQSLSILLLATWQDEEDNYRN
jgi:hypothetical protein